ncbi:hypothetical protein B5X24_HaOG214872 [Helicoverpa armigera]|nr:hypothetical protein B5X24_HaOG214872 [Helicoverpa armigera]
MLSGAILCSAPVSLRGLAPGLPAARPALLAALVMHALHDRQDEASFIGQWNISYDPERSTGTRTATIAVALDRHLEIILFR